jgi:hypothetical protein
MVRGRKLARDGCSNGVPSPRHEGDRSYLDEFAFRFNRRRSKARGVLFHSLAQQAVTVGPATYDNIVGNIDSTRPPIALA